MLRDPLTAARQRQCEIKQLRHGYIELGELSSIASARPASDL